MFAKKNDIHIVLLWLFLVIIGLSSRSYFPIDETRYATVAWNMWLSGDYLVPSLNGVAYSHKPPLLFWLINLGWQVFGVNDWWPRLVPSFFALGSVFITQKIASLLWPDQTKIAFHASLILISSSVWVVYSTTLMFDMLVTFFTLLGVWGLLISYHQQSTRGWFLFGIAIGGGLLAKGPTIILQLLPLAFLAAWWGKSHLINAKNWYFPLAYAFAGGLITCLFWAIPAGISGGSDYMHAIFWGQSVDRIVGSFAHDRPIWWYIPILPAILFPWSFWGTFWQGLFNKKLIHNESGVRFCIAWIFPVFVVFSLISGKQVHYLLSLLPAFALLIARYSENSFLNKRLHIMPISITMILIGMISLYLPYYASTQPLKMATWLQMLPDWLGYLSILLGIILLALPKQNLTRTSSQIAFFSITLITFALYVLMHTSGSAYDVRPISAQLQLLESKHVPLAHAGKYPGTFNFLGRLKQSPTILKAEEIEHWFIAHPQGRLIKYYENSDELNKHAVEFQQAFKGDFVAILTYQQWLEQAKLAR
jgi:4-amino-4-deoxy-L-arabinose transferase-like glycosyltransferase